MPTRLSKLGVLRGVDLFSACTTRELTSIAALVDEVSFRSGETVVLEGGPGREFYAIIEGKATVTLKKKKLATLDAGSFFGEMSLLDQGPRAATVTAATDLRTYVLDAKNFAALLDKHPAVARKILRGMAQRLRALEQAKIG